LESDSISPLDETPDTARAKRPAQPFLAKLKTMQNDIDEYQELTYFNNQSKTDIRAVTFSGVTAA